MGLLDMFSNPSSGGLLRSYEAYGIDPNEVRRMQLQQGLLQAAAGMLQGNNLGTGLASGLGGFAQGAMAGRDAALQEGVLNYKIKQDQAEAERKNKAWERILAGNNYLTPGLNAPGNPLSTGPGSPSLPAGSASPALPGSAVPHGLPTGQVGDFDSVVNFVLDQEGGYVADDAGHGPSNFGINQEANPDVDVAKLTRDDAVNIYRNKYWAGINGDHLPPATALVAMDTAVNNGLDTARRLLKGTGGDPQKMIEARRGLYGDLEKKPQYAGYGDTWRKRMADLTAAIGSGQPQDGFIQVADASGAVPGSAVTPRQTIEPYLTPGQRQAFTIQLQAAYAADDLGAAATVQANALKAAEANAQRDMEARGKAPQSRQRNEGDKVIEEEFDPNSGKWNKISEAPRWQPQAVEMSSGPFAGKSADSSALNIIYDYQSKQQRGDPVSAEETTAYNIAIAKTAQLISDPVSGEQFIFSPITRQAVRLGPDGKPVGEPFEFNGEQPGGGASPQGQVGLSGRDIPGRSGTFDEGSTVLEAAGEGTGFVAGLAQWYQATVGQIPGAPQADETVAAANGLRLFNQTVKQALVNNPRFPVAEQDIVEKMLPDPGALFSNPADQQNRIRQLYEYIKIKQAQNTRALSTRGLSLDKRRDLMDQNSDLESAINLMQSMPIIGQAGGPDQPDVLKFDDNGELLRGSVRG